MRRFQGIHIARGYAALLVLLYHITAVYASKVSYVFLFNFFLLGHIGLDFFFILSGFIITYVHFEDRGKPARLTSYLKKRFTRIYPTYWAALLLTLAAYIISGRNVAALFQLTPLKSLFAFLLVPIWPHPIPPSWSLSYEVFFYILFAFAILLHRHALTIMAVSYSIFLIIYNYVIRGAPRTFASEFFILEFFMGVGIAYLTRHRIMMGKKTASAALVISLVLLVASWTYNYILQISGVTVNNNLRIFFFALPFSLFVYASVSLELQSRISAHPFFIMLGDISYSLYLTHSVVVVALLTVVKQIVVPRYILPYISIAVIATAVGAAYVFHRFVELPLMRSLTRLFVKKPSL